MPIESALLSTSGARSGAATADRANQQSTCTQKGVAGIVSAARPPAYRERARRHYQPLQSTQHALAIMENSANLEVCRDARARRDHRSRSARLSEQEWTPNRYTVVPGGQEVTGQACCAVPSRVLSNNQTGQLVDLGAPDAIVPGRQSHRSPEERTRAGRTRLTPSTDPAAGPLPLEQIDVGSEPVFRSNDWPRARARK